MGTAGVLFSLARLSGERPRIGKRGARVDYDQDAVTIFADEPMPVEVDGDYLGLREKLVFRTAAAAVRVLI